MTITDGSDRGPLDPAALQTLLLEAGTFHRFLTELAAAAADVTGRRCGITTRGSKGPYTVASSNPIVDQLDELQYLEGRGPCLEAMRTGEVVAADDMASETRWAPYPAQAHRLGVQSVLSTPMPGRDRTLGALNLYSFDDQGISDTERAEAARFAGQSAGALELALRTAEHHELIDNLQVAITSRSVIDQAIGVLMARHGIGAEAAFASIRKTSQDRNIKVRDVAAGLIKTTQG